MNSEREYWFPAKPYGAGYGWGLPIAWQGWVALAIFLVLIVGGAILLVPLGQLVVIGYSVAVAAVFILICGWKGEPQHTRPQ
jgi:hypothetical protein